MSLNCRFCACSKPTSANQRVCLLSPVAERRRLAIARGWMERRPRRAILSPPSAASTAPLDGRSRRRSTPSRRPPRLGRVSGASRISHALSRPYHSFIGPSPRALCPHKTSCVFVSFACCTFLPAEVRLRASVSHSSYRWLRRRSRISHPFVPRAPFVWSCRLHLFHSVMCLEHLSRRGTVGRRVSLPSPVSAPAASARRRQLVVLRVIRSVAGPARCALFFPAPSNPLFFLHTR